MTKTFCDNSKCGKEIDPVNNYQHMMKTRVYLVGATADRLDFTDEFIFCNKECAIEGFQEYLIKLKVT